MQSLAFVLLEYVLYVDCRFRHQWTGKGWNMSGNDHDRLISVLPSNWGKISSIKMSVKTPFWDVGKKDPAAYAPFHHQRTATPRPPSLSWGMQACSVPDQQRKIGGKKTTGHAVHRKMFCPFLPTYHSYAHTANYESTTQPWQPRCKWGQCIMSPA